MYQLSLFQLARDNVHSLDEHGFTWSLLLSSTSDCLRYLTMPQFPDQHTGRENPTPSSVYCRPYFLRVKSLFLVSVFSVSYVLLNALCEVLFASQDSQNPQILIRVVHLLLLPGEPPPQQRCFPSLRAALYAPTVVPCQLLRRCGPIQTQRRPPHCSEQLEYYEAHEYKPPPILQGSFFFRSSRCSTLM